MKNFKSEVKIMSIAYKAVEAFYDYLIIDENGWAGIREDAPEEAKKAYAKFKKMEQDALKDGIKL